MRLKGEAARTEMPGKPPEPEPRKDGKWRPDVPGLSAAEVDKLLEPLYGSLARTPLVKQEHVTKELARALLESDPHRGLFAPPEQKPHGPANWLSSRLHALVNGGEKHESPILRKRVEECARLMLKDFVDEKTTERVLKKLAHVTMSRALLGAEGESAGYSDGYHLHFYVPLLSSEERISEGTVAHETAHFLQTALTSIFLEDAFRTAKVPEDPMLERYYRDNFAFYSAEPGLAFFETYGSAYAEAIAFTMEMHYFGVKGVLGLNFLARFRAFDRWTKDHGRGLRAVPALEEILRKDKKRFLEIITHPTYGYYPVFGALVGEA